MRRRATWWVAAMGLVALSTACSGEQAAAPNTTSVTLADDGGERVDDTVASPPVDPPAEVAGAFDETGLTCPSTTRIEEIAGGGIEFTAEIVPWRGVWTACTYDSTSMTDLKTSMFVMAAYEPSDRALRESVTVDGSDVSPVPELGPDVVQVYREREGVHTCTVISVEQDLTASVTDLTGYGTCLIATRIYDTVFLK